MTGSARGGDVSEGVARPAVVDPDETDLLPRQVYLACRPDEGTDGPA